MTQEILLKYLLDSYKKDILIGKKGWRSNIEIQDGAGLTEKHVNTYMVRLRKRSSSMGIYHEGDIWIIESKSPRANRKRAKLNRWVVEDNACTAYKVYRIKPKDSEPKEYSLAEGFYDL